MPYEPICSPKDFEDRVRLGTPRPGEEDLFLEFKGKCRYDEPDKSKRQQGAREAARDIVQFSNTADGTVLYGVGEKKDPDTNVTTASGIVPMPDVTKATEWLVKAIERYVYPATPQPAVTPIHIGTQHVIAVNIEPAVELQGVWDRHEPTQGMEFLYRNNNKKAQMTMDEVAIRLGSGVRAKRLRLKQLLDRTPSSEGHKRATIYHAHVGMFSGDVRVLVKSVPGTCTLEAIDEEQFAVRVWKKDNKKIPEPVDVPYVYLAALWWDARANKPVLQLNATLDAEQLTPIWR